MRRLTIIATLFMLTSNAYGLFANRVSNGEELGILTLGGIVNSTANDNVALIKELSSGKVSAVKVGNYLLNQFIIRKIARKYILLEKRDGDLLLVYQSKFESEFKNIGQTQAQADPGSGKLASSTTDEYREDGFERKSNKVRMTGVFREQLIKHDLAKVMMQATAIPYIEDNEVRGFALTEIEEGSIYQHLGFIPADIVTAINGVALNDAAGAIRLLNSLRNASAIDIAIIRGGEPLMISAVIQ